jgi:hypothetical protein
MAAVVWRAAEYGIRQVAEVPVGVDENHLRGILANRPAVRAHV